MSNTTVQHKSAQIGTDIAIDSDDEVEPKTDHSKAEKPAKSAAARVGLFVLVSFSASLAWHVGSDLIAPSSSAGSVSTSILQIAPRVSGQVSEVFIIDNQPVERGEELFALDPAPFQLAVRQAELALEQAVVSHDASAVNIAGARAQVDQAQANLENAQATADRTRSLFERGLTTRAQLDGVDLQVATARSTLSSAEASLESAQLQVGQGGEGNPQVEAARVQLEQAELNLHYSTVTAPSDGFITNLRLYNGQFVNAGAPALTFIDRSQPWIVVDMRENQLANIEVGDPASLVFDAVPGHTFEGRVQGIAWGIDPGRMAANGLPQNQPSTRWFEPARKIPVQIVLEETEDWPLNARAGSKVSALIFAQERSHPVAIVSKGLQVVQSYLSYLY